MKYNIQQNLTQKQITKALKTGKEVTYLLPIDLYIEKPNEQLFLHGETMRAYGPTIKKVIIYGHRRLLCEFDFFGKKLYGWVDQDCLSIINN